MLKMRNFQYSIIRVAKAHKQNSDLNTQIQLNNTQMKKPVKT